MSAGILRRAALGVLAVASCVLATAAPAARAEVVWLCNPALAEDPCRTGQDTTVRSAGSPDRVVTPRTGPRGIDCFYVYPTVSNQTTPNADKSRDPELESIAKYQAARFATQCRLFAPVYRQSTLASIGTGYASGSRGDAELAFGDVLEAWRAYLRSDNGGRGVVLVGHSQGTGMLRRLLRTEIEPRPAQRRRLVGGLLIGGNVTVEAGKLLGGDFRRTPLCTQRAQVGCVVAFSTFAEDPPENARFGVSRPPSADNPAGFQGGPGFEVACTDPRPLAGARGLLRILVPSEPYAPGPIAAGVVITSGGVPPSASTTWVVPPDRFEGGCRTINGANVLRYEPLAASRRPVFFPEPSWGTHLIDVQLGLDALVSLVRQQARRWTAPRIRLTRRCAAGGRLRVGLAGREASFVRRVTFRTGRRLLARDAARPFRATARVPSGARGRLRAVARLQQGQPHRVVRTRALPRCAA